MAEQLEYARDTDRFRRRRRLLGGSCAVVIIASAIFAVPRFRELRAWMDHRSAVRDEFMNELASAENSLDQKRIEDASIALYKAQFPRWTQAKLFWKWELAEFDRRAKVVQDRIDREMPAILEKQDRAASESRDEVKIEDSQTTSDAIHCILIVCRRSGTIAALHQRAIEQLRRDNFPMARAICDQIVELDPLHQFGPDFWANVSSN